MQAENSLEPESLRLSAAIARLAGLTQDGDLTWERHGVYFHCTYRRIELGVITSGGYNPRPS